MEQTLRGRIEHIIFTSRDSGFAVLEVKTENGRETVAGDIGEVSVGDDMEFYGTYTDHPTYGVQFSVKFCTPVRPSNAVSILRYLINQGIKGVGPATARRIVSRFGDDTLNVIENDSSALTAVRGISEQKARLIHEEYKATFGAAEAILSLRGAGFGREESLKIYKILGEGARDMIEQNPYLICSDAIGLPFEKAEEMAAGFNHPANSLYRVSAGIEWVLRHNLANGHTCLPKDKLLKVADRLLEVGEDTLLIALDELMANRRVLAEKLAGEEMIFLPDMYSAESFIAGRIALMLGRRDTAQKVTDTEIAALERANGVTYAAAQKQAVKAALDSGLLILTGGPGTGKTTAIKAIISAMESRNMKIELAAPTGRAAKRMEELCGRTSRTIHRLLEVEWGEDDRPYFRKNEREMLDCDAVILDEVSMVDSLLFCALLKAMPLACRLIVVGDSDQLPSVGAGNVLADLVGCGLLPCVQLKEVFRQAAQSLIVRNAHAIIGGLTPEYNEKDGDFYLVKAANPIVAARTVRDLVSRRLPASYGFSGDDIQVLCPSRLMETGTVRLNNIIQQELNPAVEGSPEVKMKDFCLRVGDRVMQIKNNYDIAWRRLDGEEGTGIFNGDIGYIEAIDPAAGTATVRFDDRTAEYYGDEIAQLEPAWAITIHKSQGSEYECVVLPLIDFPQKLQYRNLLYTAVTRAKTLLCIVGNEQVIENMIRNDRKTLRYTGLKEMIKQGAEQ